MVKSLTNDCDFMETLDEPIYIIFNNLLLDEVDASYATGNAFFKKSFYNLPNENYSFSAQFYSGLTSKDANINVPYGTVQDCLKIGVGFQYDFTPNHMIIEGGVDFYISQNEGLVFAGFVPGFDYVELFSLQ